MSTWKYYIFYILDTKLYLKSVINRLILLILFFKLTIFTFLLASYTGFWEKSGINLYSIVNWSASFCNYVHFCFVYLNFQLVSVYKSWSLNVGRFFSLSRPYIFILNSNLCAIIATVAFCHSNLLYLYMIIFKLNWNKF